MSKTSRRIARPTSPLISPALRDQLVLRPHAHLEMFFSGTAEIEQMKIVASFLNMGSVMAAFSRDGQRQAAFHRALDIVAHHVRARTGDVIAAPSPGERKELEQCFTMLDRWLGVQTIRALHRADDFINRAIQTRANADVETVFGDSEQQH